MTRAALHVGLRSDIRAFDFAPDDFALLRAQHPDLDLVFHDTPEALRAAREHADFVTAWSWRAADYADATRLRAVFTPAAGRDWVQVDPAGRVDTVFGRFHGPMIAESLLQMMLHWNRRMPAMLANAAARGWDRDLQFPGTLLRHQSVLLVGYGHVGRACARLLQDLGMEVTGCRRNPPSPRDPATDTRMCTVDALPDELGRADHVVLLLPGGPDTRGFMNRARLAACKPGAWIYNFGRGSTLLPDDLLQALDHGPLAGAGLDVTEPEPLPPTSPLWGRDDVLILPHSSCVYAEYRALHVAELSDDLRRYL